jgi:hypothetical protein
MTRMIVLLSDQMPHLVLTALFALGMSGIIAALGKRGRRERAYYAGWFFVCSIASAVAGSWIMYAVHG